MPKDPTKSSLKSSRSSKPMVEKKGVRFDKLARTISSNPQEVLAADIENHHKQNPRLSKSHYRPVFKFKTPYTEDVMGDNPTNRDVAWQTAEEYANAKIEKRDEAIRNGYKWSVDAVSDDLQTVTVSNLENPEESKTVSTSEFKYFPIVGEIYKKIRYIFGRGGKRTKKRRRTKKRKN